MRCILLGLFCAQVASAAPTLLYDVDFESPTYSVDTQIAPGGGDAPRNTPDEVLGAPPVVHAASGQFDSQFAYFNTKFSGSWHGSGLIFDLSDRDYGLGFDDYFDRYRLELDLSIISLLSTNAEFRIYADTDYFRSIIFDRSGVISKRIPEISSDPIPIGSFEFEDLMHVTLEVDRIAHTWQLKIDNEVLIDELLLRAREFDRFRVVLWEAEYPNASRAGVDNIRIWGIPEPASLMLLVMAALAGYRR